MDRQKGRTEHARDLVSHSDFGECHNHDSLLKTTFCMTIEVAQLIFLALLSLNLKNQLPDLAITWFTNSTSMITTTKDGFALFCSWHWTCLSSRVPLQSPLQFGAITAPSMKRRVSFKRVMAISVEIGPFPQKELLYMQCILRWNDPLSGVAISSSRGDELCPVIVEPLLGALSSRVPLRQKLVK